MKIKQIPGFGDKYSCDENGQVYSSWGKGRKLKQILIWTGYLRVILNNKDRYKYFYVHRLVYETFFGTIPKGKQVNHINGIKSDNRLKNLELVTPKENTLHALKNNLKKNENNGLPRLTQEEINTIKFFHGPRGSQKILCKIFKRSRATIYNISKK